MKETSALKGCRETIMDNGMAHLIYEEEDFYDIVHPFSIPDYELITDEFYDFLGKYRSIIPEKAPIVLEITGKKQSRREKSIIENAIHTQAMLDLTETQQDVRTYVKRCLFYTLCTALTFVLVLAFGAMEQEIPADIVYILFWFFGERLLEYLVMSLLPALSEKRWYERLAAMKLLFTRRPVGTLENLDPEQVEEEEEEKEEEAREDVSSNQMLEDYLMENGIAQLGCRVQELDDIIAFPDLKTREILSDDMAGYLDQVLPFVKSGVPVRLEVQGPEFTEKEQEKVRRAIRNYYYFRRAQEEHGILVNRRNIISFAIFAVISAAVLAERCEAASLAGYELILMIFWFFADWLLEFILITRKDINKDIAKLDACRDMEVSFTVVE